MTIQLTTNRK